MLPTVEMLARHAVVHEALASRWEAGIAQARVACKDQAEEDQNATGGVHRSLTLRDLHALTWLTGVVCAAPVFRNRAASALPETGLVEGSRFLATELHTPVWSCGSRRLPSRETTVDKDAETNITCLSPIASAG